MKTVEQYLSLPYTIVLKRDADGDIVARVDELPGCASHGADDTEALAAVREAMTLWIEDALERGHAIPEPKPEDDVLPSGKWVQRVPRSVHLRLVKAAKIDGVSLNHLAATMLAEGLGARDERAAVQTATAMFFAAQMLVATHNRASLMRSWSSTEEPPAARIPKGLRVVAGATASAVGSTAQTEAPHTWS